MKRVGLFVGIDVYKNGISSLQCACNDAKSLCFAFSGSGYSVDLLQNEEAHCDHIIDRVSDMISGLKKDDIFLFYFSGHGREHNGVHYLVGPTGHAKDSLYKIGSLAIPDLIEITNIPGLNRLFILDCCRSNILSGRDGIYSCDAGRDISLESAVLPDADSDIVPPLILSSCSTGEQSFENYETGHGYFTEMLLRSIENKKIQSFYHFQNSLNIIDTPKPQNICWNGNLSNWEKVLLFNHWSPGLVQTTFNVPENPELKYEMLFLKREAETLKAEFAGPISSKSEELLKLASDAENDFAYSSAIKFFTQAVAQLKKDFVLDAENQFEKGEELFNDKLDGDFPEALKWFQKAAQLNHPGAQYRLGDYYYLGLCNMKQDYSEAMKWYFKAAEYDYEDAEAKGLLAQGHCYDAENDYVNAFDCYMMASEQGNTEAQYWLGTYYFQGKGVPQNFVEALRWYRKAAEEGDNASYYRTRAASAVPEVNEKLKQNGI